MTLIELLVTMAILAILLAVGIPMYQSVTTQTRIKGEMFSLLSDINFARSEAIKRGQPVWVCSSSDGATCSDVGASSSDWGTGRLVYVDVTNSGLVNSPPASSVLRVSPALSHGDTFTGGTAIHIAQTGYEFMTGTASIHDAANNIGNRNCLSIVSGLASTSTGAACP